MSLEIQKDRQGQLGLSLDAMCSLVLYQEMCQLHLHECRLQDEADTIADVDKCTEFLDTGK